MRPSRASDSLPVPIVAPSIPISCDHTGPDDRADASRSEAPAGLAERLALAETEHLGRRDREDDGPAAIAVEGTIAHGEMPARIFLRVPIDQAPERGFVAHAHRVALDHDIETGGDGVVAGRDDAVAAVRQV